MSTSAAPRPAADGIGSDPLALFYQRADALYRCARECCRQHERLAALVERGAMVAEQRAAQSLVALCDEALVDLAGLYERAAGAAHPEGGDACWHAANALWMACREYARRQRTSQRAARGIGEGGDHCTARLAEIALDYDLEASALLLLRQATERYGRVRPAAA